jgi:hypothetical protein
MTRRLLALGLLLVAGLVHAGVTLPARRARDEARTAFARQREARERLRAELARLERRASAVRAAAPEGDAAAARAMRLALLAATRGLPLGDLQIAARPARHGSVAARGRVGGTGSQTDLLRLAERLAEPASGVMLERLDLALHPEGIRLEAETISVRAES